jgi:preprotein translocase subunit Sec63
VIRGLVVVVLVLVAIWWLRGLILRVEPPHAEPSDWDPWAVLGLPRGSGRDQIVQAYRERLKEYHPDRVADLGRELREVAHRRTVEIQRAYDELTRSVR